MSAHSSEPVRLARLDRVDPGLGPRIREEAEAIVRRGALVWPPS